jgi:hypothetical protein
MSDNTPILGREALLSLVDWVNTMRRKQHEQPGTGESELRDDHSGESDTSDRGAVGSDDAAESASDHTQHGGTGEDGA